MPRKICVVTGTRAEYGLLRPVMRAIEADRKLHLQLVVAGMHLSRRFGYTVREVSADGFRVDARVRMTPAEDTSEAYAASVGLGVRGLARAFARLKPDVVLVLGDRVEAFAAATAAALSNIIVAHMHGGDRARAGHDDYMRHAITKMSHLHFAATRASARRIRRLGERPDRIWVVGAPGLDEIRSADLPSPDLLRRRYRLDPTAPFLLVVQHPVSTRPARAAAEMRATLAAVVDSGLPALVVYPNADAGGRAMIAEIERAAERHAERLRAVPSLPRLDYLALLKHAACLVGNSSSGIIEAPALKTAAVNVGDRQEGRERGGNVIDVGSSRREILRGIRKALEDGEFRRRLARCRNPYGDGRTGPRVARILARVPLDGGLRRKRITY